MEKYKIVYNIGEEEEKSIFFDRLTLKKVKEMEKAKSYILFEKQTNFYNIYIPIDYKLNEKQKEIYNQNCNFYASRKYKSYEW